MRTAWFRWQLGPLPAPPADTGPRAIAARDQARRETVLKAGADSLAEQRSAELRAVRETQRSTRVRDAQAEWEARAGELGLQPSAVPRAGGTRRRRSPPCRPCFPPRRRPTGHANGPHWTS
jgi:hypothetical protein